MQAAAAAYIKLHAATLLAGIPVGGRTAVTPAALAADGVLTNFGDWNAFGQKHVLVIAQPAAGRLEAMVYTYGGDTIPDLTAIRVAEAGPANATVVLSSDPANFEGAAGGQTVPAATFAAAGYPIAPGHIGAHLEAAAYAAEAPFLNRYATGNLDDNTMHTPQYMAGNDLNMQGGNLNTAKTVTATQQVTAPTMVDPADATFQLTPAGTSQVNILNTTGDITAGLNGSRNMYATNYYHPSDRRLKTNIRPIEDPLGLVRNITGHRFDWRDTGRPDLGFIAQEVQKVLPEAVGTLPDGKLAVRYDILAAPLAEAVKTEAAEIARLRADIETLKGQAP